LRSSASQRPPVGASQRAPSHVSRDVAAPPLAAGRNLPPRPSPPTSALAESASTARVTHLSSHPSSESPIFRVTHLPSHPSRSFKSPIFQITHLLSHPSSESSTFQKMHLSSESSIFQFFHPPPPGGANFKIQYIYLFSAIYYNIFRGSEGRLAWAGLR
jgi:hypothetical protein